MQHTAPPYDILKFGRNERLVDRFIASEAHTIDAKAGQCLMVITVEIENPWHHAREFGQQILSSLVREFVRSESNSNLIRFEQSLKLANHVIGQAHEKLGVPIGCAVALFSGEEIHFAVTGPSKILLVRNSQLSDVTATEGSDLEQFSSVTSGDLTSNEWLIVTNAKMAAFLTNVEPAVWSENDLGALGAQLIELAPAHERDQFSAVVLRYNDGSLRQEQTILWDTLEHVTPIKLPKLTLPKIRTDTIIQALRSWAKRLIDATKSVVGKVQALRLQRTPRVPKPEGPKVTSEGARRFRLPRLTIRSRWQVMAIIVFLILLIIGSKTLITRLRAPKNEPTPTTLVEELVATAVGQRAAFLTEHFSFDRYRSLPEEQKQTFAQALSAENISVLNTTNVISELPQTIAAVDSFNDILAAIDNDGQLWFIKEGRAVKVEQSVQITKPISVAMIAEDRILVSDEASNIWLFDGAASQPAALPVASALATGPKIIQKFGRNVYVYHAASKTIYRQTNFDKDLNSLRPFVKSDITPADVTDVAINGQIVTLDKTGKISIFQANKLVSQNLNVPAALPLHITAVEGNPKLYALAGKMLYVVDSKAGSVQAVFPLAPTPLTELTLDSSGKSLWLIFDKTIQRISL